MSNNNISNINAWSLSLAESVPLCSCSPETFDTALSSTDDVDGGILFFDCYPVNGSSIPLNLE